MADDLLRRAAEGLRDPIGLQCAGMREDLRAGLAELLDALDDCERNADNEAVPTAEWLRMAARRHIAAHRLAAKLLGAGSTPDTGSTT
jgi:hypothetical protein